MAEEEKEKTGNFFFSLYHVRGMLCAWQGGQEAQSGTFGTVRHKQCQVSQRKVTISHNCGHSSDMGEGSTGNSSKLEISSE